LTGAKVQRDTVLKLHMRPTPLPGRELYAAGQGGPVRCTEIAAKGLARASLQGRCVVIVVDAERALSQSSSSSW
jgi:hypothetical protein